MKFAVKCIKCPFGKYPGQKKIKWTLGHNLLFGPSSIMDKSKFKTNSFITQFVSVNFLLSLNVWSECISKEFTIEIYEVDNCLTLIGLPFLGCVAKTLKNLASVDAYPYAEKSSHYVFALWFAKESLFLNKALENMHLRNMIMWKRKNWNIIKKESILILWHKIIFERKI